MKFIIINIFLLLSISSCSLQNFGEQHCTEAGCTNNIIVAMPKPLTLKPDTYIITTRTNTGKTQKHTFKVSKSYEFKFFNFLEIGGVLPETVTVEIRNSNNILVSKQSNKVYFDKTTAIYPNGKKCGGACYIGYLKPNKT